MPDSPEGISLSVFESIGLSTNEIELVGHGRNGVVVKVRSGNEKPFVAKWYNINRHHSVDRMHREFEALSFLASQDFEGVARPLELFAEKRIATYSLISGVRPKPEDGAAGPMFDFVIQLDQLYHSAHCDWFEPAVEACPDYGSILNQIKMRLDQVAEDSKSELLQSPLRMQIKQGLENLTHLMDVTSTLKRKTLTSSDFGPHNMLVDNGKASFVDFEYFGIDSAARMTADVLWHPGSRMTLDDRVRFARLSIDYFSETSDLFADEVYRVLPFIGLRWVSIMMRSPNQVGTAASAYLQKAIEMSRTQSSLEERINQAAFTVSQ